jgi:hypothetical protein
LEVSRERTLRMSPTKKRQTMGKMNRERELKERRDLKKEKKDEKKAAAARGEETPDVEPSPDLD